MASLWKKILPQVNPRVLYTLLSVLIVLSGTVLAIWYAKGNYRVTRQGVFPESGLLSANSFPTGAQVFIDDQLQTATDDTIYLAPAEYTVTIAKDGYTPWEKKMQIERELVTQTNALLFPIAPRLSPLTFTGLENLSPSPDGQRLLYYTASSSAMTRNGLYLLDLNGNALTLQRGPRQVAEDAQGYDLKTAEFIWSPDSTQVIMIDTASSREVLLDLDRKNDVASLDDISLQRERLLSEWESEMYVRERQFLAAFPDPVIAIATKSATNVFFSPDKNRLLFTATASASLGENLTPPVLAKNSQPQERTFTPGGIYVYDRKEDTTFRVGTDGAFVNASTSSAQLANLLNSSKSLLAQDLYSRSPLSFAASPSAFMRLQATQSAVRSAENFKRYHSSLYVPTFQWFPDSNHLIYTQDNEIRVKEYDNTNDVVVYSGPFASDFVYPWPDGSKLLILTGFSSGSPANLYAVELR